MTRIYQWWATNNSITGTWTTKPAKGVGSHRIPMNLIEIGWGWPRRFMQAVYTQRSAPINTAPIGQSVVMWFLRWSSFSFIEVRHLYMALIFTWVRMSTMTEQISCNVSGEAFRHMLCSWCMGQIFEVPLGIGHKLWASGSLIRHQSIDIKMADNCGNSAE